MAAIFVLTTAYGSKHNTKRTPLQVSLIGCKYAASECDFVTYPIDSSNYFNRQCKRDIVEYTHNISDNQDSPASSSCK